MSLRIKIFSTTQNNVSSLEDEVNAWLSVNTDFLVKDIKVSFSEHSILMTLIFEPSTRSLTTMMSQTSEVAPPPSFQQVLSSFSPKQEPAPQPKTHNSNPNVAAMESISPSSVKPGKLIKNNYSKYSKGNQTISEDQAFNWD